MFDFCYFPVYLEDRICLIFYCCHEAESTMWRAFQFKPNSTKVAFTKLSHSSHHRACNISIRSSVFRWDLHTHWKFILGLTHQFFCCVFNLSNPFVHCSLFPTLQCTVWPAVSSFVFFLSLQSFLDICSFQHTICGHKSSPVLLRFLAILIAWSYFY